MNILVLGGTKFVGVHLVNYLLAAGHDVTIATRGRAQDPFAQRVGRIILERTDEESIRQALRGRHFDVVYDSQAYSSNEIKYLLDAVTCERYIQVSTASVYAPHFRLAQTETDFDPTTHPLKWCARDDFGYDEVKRQAECAMFQAYGHVPAVAVRFPLIVGPDDYTQRLYFYVQHIVQSKAMHIDNLPVQLAFILSDEAGKFLAWLAQSSFCGSINAANAGTAQLRDIIDYVQNKINTPAIILPDGGRASFNGFPDYGLDLQRASGIGYTFPALDAPLYALLDTYMAQASTEA